MSHSPKLPIWYFLQMMFFAFLLFFLTVGMGKEAGELIVYMNDSRVQKSPREWAVFIPLAIVATALWCVFWLLFKHAEKKCLEFLDEKKT